MFLAITFKKLFINFHEILADVNAERCALKLFASPGYVHTLPSINQSTNQNAYI